MLIELRNIHKYYGAVHANRDVCLTIEPGVVHGILGENGAGKSTLMKVLSGYITRSAGDILVDGREVDFAGPADATRLGIGMLYQDPLDFPPLSVLENFMLGQSRKWKPEAGHFENRLRSLTQAFGFSLNPCSPVERLTVGERQQLELLRLLALDVRVLILDEPTTGISATQKELLFQALRQLAQEGRSILLVSHKLEDIEALCDRVTVLRYGEIAGEMVRPFQTGKLLKLMFGIAPSPPPRRSAPPGDVVLSFRHVGASGGRAGLHDCTVSIRRREVVGLAGLEGSGQGVFLRAAAGLQAIAHGELALEGRSMKGKKHRAFKRAGVVFLPASRLEEGLIPQLTLTEHFILAFHQRSFWLPWKKARKTAQQRINRFRIKGFPQSSAEALSGGNQQRLLLSLMPASPRVLLLEQPTRGLDMESAHRVWQHLHQYRNAKDTTIVFSSAELDEILQVADRILVFFNGRMVLDTKAGEVGAAELGRAIAGKEVSSRSELASGME